MRPANAPNKLQLTLPLALLLLSACSSAPVLLPPEPPLRPPPLLKAARQPTPPPDCSPTCSAGASRSLESWLTSPIAPTLPARPASAPTTL